MKRSSAQIVYARRHFAAYLSEEKDKGKLQAHLAACLLIK
jgi:hypothetical protein